MLMAVYNEKPQFLNTAVRSILRQSYTNFEFIIIDDCCTNGSSRMIRQFAQNDARIKVIRNQKNEGLTVSLNRGLCIAKGTYIARMDSDDISSQKRFAIQAEYMQQHPDIAAAGAQIIDLDTGKKLSLLHHSKDDDITKIRMVFGNAGIVHPTAFIRKEFLDHNKIRYNESYPRAQDYALWSEILYKGGKIREIKKVLLRYRIHKAQITSRFKQDQDRCMDAVRLENIKRYFIPETADINADRLGDLAEGKQGASLKEDLDAVLKLIDANQGLNPDKLEKELLILWWRRAVKFHRSYRYMANTFALRIIRPEHMLYVLKYMLEKLSAR